MSNNFKDHLLDSYQLKMFAQGLIRNNVRNAFTIFREALHHGKKEIIQAFLNVDNELFMVGRPFSDWEDCFGNTPLILAAKMGNVQAIKGLLGHDTYKQESESVGVIPANIDRANQDGTTAIIEAAERGYDEIVELLLECGADVDAKDQNADTALLLASCYEHISTVKILLVYGANVNYEDQSGYTPLIWASKQGNRELAKLLLDKRAHTCAADFEYPDVEYPGYSPLIWASLEGNKEIVELLLAAGAEVDAETKYGDTALIVASDKEIARLLLDGGADINAVNQRGATALSRATCKDHAEIVEFLISRGAKQ